MDIEPTSNDKQTPKFSEKITPEFVQIFAVGLGEIILNFLQNHIPLIPVFELILTLFQVFLFIGVPLAIREINRKREAEFLPPFRKNDTPALSLEPPKFLDEPSETIEKRTNRLKESDSPEELIDPNLEQEPPSDKGEQK